MVKLTPAMGWNSWNTFGENINEQLILEMTDEIIAKGLDKCGYEYVVIDDCWSMKERDENGRLVADPEKFPHGMKYVADYVHSKGLKFGMYSCCGTLTCAGYPGSYEHEYVDAATFAEWGVDFLKYDYCYHPVGAPSHLLYKRMSAALASTGRDILFSACTWGGQDTKAWIRETNANMWRSTGDILDNFESIKKLIRQEIRHLQYNGQGCFNDLDMLVVGISGGGNSSLPDENGVRGCTNDEYMTHFAFWCLFGSPLMIGCDLRKVSDEALAIMKNPDLIRINQDLAYRQPFFLTRMNRNTDPTGDYYDRYPDTCPLLARFLDDGTIAIGLFNLSERPTFRGFSSFLTEAVGVPESSGKTLLMRDIFTGEETKVTNGTFSIACEPHCCKVYIAKIVDK